MAESGRSGRPTPLLRTDPPRLGDVDLTGRLEVTDAGIVYAGLLADHPVAVALLTAGAETDSYARARFHDALEEADLAGDDLPLVARDDSPEIAPWVAVRAETWDDGAKLAGALLAPVTLEHVAPVGTVSGPGFRPHWADRPGPGRWRVWPLPWPSIVSTAGRWTFVASFAIVLAIAAIALFIAVRLFENQPPAPVNPPFPLPSPISPSPQRPTPTPTPTPSPPASGGPTRTLTTNTGNPPFV